jgi:hypothetical protein
MLDVHDQARFWCISDLLIAYFERSLVELTRYFINHQQIRIQGTKHHTAWWYTPLI